MNIGNFVYQTNLPVKESDLIPASSIQKGKDQEAFFRQYNKEVPLYETIREIAEKHEINPSYIYLTPNRHLELYCYYDFPIFISLMAFDDHYLQLMQMRERISFLRRKADDAIKNRKIMKILAFSDDSAKIMLFNKLYWHLTDSDRYISWVEVYQMLDYGHLAIDEDVTKDAFLKQPSDYRKRVLSRLDRNMQGDYLTVYRGIGKVSIKPKEAMSWTTSLAVACFFASRYGLEGKVYQARIRKDHIVDHLLNRNEEEVLLFPNHLEDIVEYPMVSLEDEFQQMVEEGYVDEYCTYRNSYIERTDYLHPDGIHGIPHIKRVLYHCLAMAKQMKLSSSDRAILANTALYHDIGRKHDDFCLEHGFWSWKKLKMKTDKHTNNFLAEINYVDQFKKGASHYDLRMLNQEEVKIIRFLIEYHCISDKEAKMELTKRSFENEERAWKLFQIFKDCDGLDRIRLSKFDLDISYLRTDMAKKRVLIAYNLPKVEQL